MLDLGGLGLNSWLLSLAIRDDLDNQDFIFTVNALNPHSVGSQSSRDPKTCLAPKSSFG